MNFLLLNAKINVICSFVFKICNLFNYIKTLIKINYNYSIFFMHKWNRRGNPFKSSLFHSWNKSLRIQNFV